MALGQLSLAATIAHRGIVLRVGTKAQARRHRAARRVAQGTVRSPQQANKRRISLGLYYDVAARKAWAEQARNGVEGDGPSKAALTFSGEILREAEEAYDAAEKSAGGGQANSGGGAQSSNGAGGGGRGQGHGKKRGHDSSWSSNWSSGKRSTWWDSSHQRGTRPQAPPVRATRRAPRTPRRVVLQGPAPRTPPRPAKGGGK